MEIQRFIFTDDLTLERKACPVRGKYIQVIDGAFVPRFELPDSLSDNEARQVIELINKIYNDGFEWGQKHRGREIARLLCVASSALKTN